MANTNKSIPEKMRLAFEAYNNMPRKNGGNPDPSDTYGLLKSKEKCHAIFTDCVKSDYSENVAFVTAVQKDDIGKIIYQAIVKSSSDQQIAVQRALSTIKQRNFTDEVAETIVKYYIEALGWNVSLPSDAVSSESSQSRNMSPSSQSVSQPVNTAANQSQPTSQSGNVSIGSQSNAQSVNLSSSQSQSSNGSSGNLQLGNNPPTPSGMNAQIPPPYQQPAYQQPAYQQPSYPQYTTTQVSQYAVPEKKKSPAIWIILILLLIIAGMVYFFFIKNKPAEEGFIAEVVPTETEMIEETEEIVTTEQPVAAETSQETELVTETEAAPIVETDAATEAETETSTENEMLPVKTLARVAKKRYWLGFW